MTTLSVELAWIHACIDRLLSHSEKDKEKERTFKAEVCLVHLKIVKDF